MTDYDLLNTDEEREHYVKREKRYLRYLEYKKKKACIFVKPFIIKQILDTKFFCKVP